MKTKTLLFLTLLTGAPSAQGITWRQNFNEAKALAAKNNQLILAAFHAPWCYSCYYMKQHVLNKEAFQNLAQKLTLVTFDVDQAEGQRLKRRYRVNFLPSYLILDAKGVELGRVAGEQPEKDFINRLQALALTPDPKAPEQLLLLMERGAIKKAAKFRDLREINDPALKNNKDWQTLAARLKLWQALEEKNPKTAKEALESLLALETGCPLAYDVKKAQSIIAPLDPAQKEKLWQKQRAALERVAQERVFAQGQETCADTRSAINALLDTYALLGLEQQKKELIERAVAWLEGQTGTAGLGVNRNAEDNLRYYLELAQKEEKLDLLYPRLIAAYPQDYVYAYRYAKNLYKRKKTQEALRWVERALPLSYGDNRLEAVLLKANILKELNQKEQAAALLRQEIQISGNRFPETARKLKLYLKKL